MDASLEEFLIEEVGLLNIHQDSARTLRAIIEYLDGDEDGPVIEILNLVQPKEVAE